jgi:hypothetical protein
MIKYRKALSKVLFLLDLTVKRLIVNQIATEPLFFHEFHCPSHKSMQPS